MMTTARIHACHPARFAVARRRAFTLVEILIAVGILAMVLIAIYSSWTAILRASKVGLDAAAAAQRSRMAFRTIETALLSTQSFLANQPYYGFFSEGGSDATLSFVSRLPRSFPRSGKFGDLEVRRVTFTLESGDFGRRQLVLRQSPVLTDWDKDEKEHPLVLAKYVSEFGLEFWDARKGWVEEWRETQTNQIPRLVKLTMRLADKPNMRREQEQEVVRIIHVPAMSVPRAFQPLAPALGGAPPGALPGTNPGLPGQPQVPPPQGPPGGPPPATL